MIGYLQDFYRQIARRKAFWMPLLFYTFGAYGFSILNRTVAADDLATSRYVNGTIWLAELRWGAVLWKRLLSFGDAVPFLDKYLSFFFLVAAGAVFACLWYVLRGQKGSVWTYTAVACMFTTYPILQEIWEYTCGGTVIVPGDFFLTFLVLLYLLTLEKLTVRTALCASLVMTLVCSSAESLAPCYVAAVMMILYYKYCVLRVQDTASAGRSSAVRCAPGGKAAWVVDGLRYALILVLAMVFRLVIGFGIMKIMRLTFTHTGDTSIRWPLTAQELRLLFGQFLTNYAAAALLYLPIAIFCLFAVLFVILVIRHCIKGRSLLPALMGFLVFLSLFLLMFIQGQVMWYRTAITLILFASFVTFLLMEHLEKGAFSSSAGMQRILCRGGILLLFLLFWRQAAYTHKLLALDNLRSDNEAAVVQQLGYDIVSRYDRKPVIFVGDYDMGHELWVRTAAEGNSRREQLYYAIRRKLTGKTSATVFVQSNVTSTIDWYQNEFDGELMDAYFAYYGYDLDVVERLSDEEKAYYTQIARELGMKPFRIEDMGEYLLVCVGRLE